MWGRLRSRRSCRRAVAPQPEHNAAWADPCDTVLMVPGADLRARLAALPVFVMAVPWQCSLGTPQDVVSVERSAVAARQGEPVDRAASAPPREPAHRIASAPPREPAHQIASAPPRRPARPDPAVAAPPRNRVAVGLGPSVPLWNLRFIAPIAGVPPHTLGSVEPASAQPPGAGPVERAAVAARHQESAAAPSATARRAVPVEPSANPPRNPGPVQPSAITAKQEPPIERVSTARRGAAVAPTITIAEEVVVKVMGTGQPLFLRCWDRALRKATGSIAGKVRLHLDIDEQGRVTAARSDSESAELSRCLVLVARQLSFPAPGQPAVVELPLMFR
jgi:hypothetical protein